MAAGILVACLAVFLTFVYWFQHRVSRTRRLIDKIPGPSNTLPLLGNAHILKDGHEGTKQFMEFCETYGREGGVTRLWVGTLPYVLLSRADTVSVLFSSNTHIKKAPFYNFAHEWLGTGLLTSYGDKWKSRRKILTPTFHFKILADFIDVFNEQTKIMVGLLKDKAKQGTVFDVAPYITLCALDIICETAMGHHTNAQNHQDGGYAEAVHGMTEIIQKRVSSASLQNELIFKLSPTGRLNRKYLKLLHSFTRKAITERSAELDNQLAKESSTITMEDLTSGKPFLIGKQKRLAFLDMLLIAAKGGADLSFSDIQEEVDTFMFEGHDTTAAASTWIVYSLGHHPDIQKKVQEEQDRIFGGTDRDLVLDDLKEMHYLECVIKETLRLFPPVPLFAREIQKECKIGEYTVPKGTYACVITKAVHLDPVHFPDPLTFDPDRWLPENSIDRHPYSYIPFSAGNRNCIGKKFAMMEEKVVWSYLMRNFTIECRQTEDEVRPVGNLILRPEKGLETRLTLRKTQA